MILRYLLSVNQTAAVTNPSLRSRSFAGRKVVQIFKGVIPCGGDPCLTMVMILRKIEEFGEDRQEIREQC